MKKGKKKEGWKAVKNRGGNSFTLGLAMERFESSKLLAMKRGIAV
jgi:hypothetical protein